MAPHAALRIPEVLALVLEESVDDKTSLARSAQCCKAFLNPALNILWRNLFSVRPLRRLLPTLYADDGSARKDLTQVPEDEWTRFDFYAQRVTRVKPNFQDFIYPAISSFFCHVAEMRPTKISFPRLRELKLAGISSTLPVTATAALIPPSLRVLFIIFSPHLLVAGSEGSASPHHPGDNILRAAAQHAPLLYHLNVHGSLPSTSITCITQFKSIRILDLSGVIGIVDQPGTNEAYRQLIHGLSISDDLVDLRLPRTLHDENIPQCSGFAHLETLHIGNKLSTVSRFISTILHCRLRTLTILPAYPEFRATCDEWRFLFEEIRLYCGSSLRCLSLQITTELDDDISLTQFLQPVMKLSGLESIAFTLPLHAKDEALHQMALAWPKMKSFQMNCLKAANPSSHLCTIRCLASFVRWCPDLVTLAIHIDEKDLPDISDIYFPSPKHGLKNLDLVANYVQDYHALARILDAAFPMLECVTTRNQSVRNPISGRPGMREFRGIEDVPRFIRELQDLRKGGRLVLPK